MREKLVKIGARTVRHGRYAIFPLGSAEKRCSPSCGGPPDDLDHEVRNRADPLMSQRARSAGPAPRAIVSAILHLLVPAPLSTRRCLTEP
jgi:hypothetical protein